VPGIESPLPLRGKKRIRGVHGLRDDQSIVAPPVATFRRPVGAAKPLVCGKYEIGRALPPSEVAEVSQQPIALLEAA
jgi:hypothetical protein